MDWEPSLFQGSDDDSDDDEQALGELCVPPPPPGPLLITAIFNTSINTKNETKNVNDEK